MHGRKQAFGLRRSAVVIGDTYVVRMSFGQLYGILRHIDGSASIENGDNIVFYSILVFSGVIALHENCFARSGCFAFHFHADETREEGKKTVIWSTSYFVDSLFPQTEKIETDCTLQLTAADAKMLNAMEIRYGPDPVDRLGELHSCKWHIIRWRRAPQNRKQRGRKKRDPFVCLILCPVRCT